MCEAIIYNQPKVTEVNMVHTHFIVFYCKSEFTVAANSSNDYHWFMKGWIQSPKKLSTWNKIRVCIKDDIVLQILKCWIFDSNNFQKDLSIYKRFQ